MSMGYSTIGWMATFLGVAVGLNTPETQAQDRDPMVLATKIDEQLAKQWPTRGVEVQPQADDAEFLRRVQLDLTGRIPSVQEVHDFLANSSTDKRARLIDELLLTPRYASHFAALWRETLTPEILALPGAGVYQPGFEGWLRQQFRNNVPYDQFVRDLLTAPISPDKTAPTPALQRPEDPNPLAFFAVKEAKPENLAATSTRVFLGVQMECAQCHDHPFAKWTRDQFWNQAAFFAGLERSGGGLFAPLSESLAKREIRPSEGKKPIAALFLDESAPSGKLSSREAFAAWVTRKGNPYFARTAANRIWGQLFGIGLVDPVDDFHDGNPPSHPELLDLLASELEAANFDLQHLIRAICRTKAYQRTSAGPAQSEDEARLFTRMPMKGLTGEQFFDSLVRATGYPNGPKLRSARTQFLSRFALGHRLAEPETSITQALTLMNGSFTSEVTQIAGSPTLRAACELPGLRRAERIEMLYLATLNRKPTPRETARLERQFVDQDTDTEAELLADLFWVLLNSVEFRVNH